MATEIALLTLRPGSDPEDESSEAYQVREKMFKTLSSQPGYVRSSWGKEVENPEIVRLYVDWDTVDAHIKFTQSEQYTAFKGDLNKIFDLPKIVIYHVHLDPYPAVELRSKSSSPVTEALTVYFPEDYSDTDRQVAVDDLNKFLAIIQKESDGACTGGSGGWAVEKRPIPNSDAKGTVFGAVLGWQSVEAHLAFRETQVFKDNIHLLRGLKDLRGLEMVHVSLQDGPGPA